MTDLISAAITLLLKRKAALETALEALALIDDDTPPAWVTGKKPASASPVKRKAGRSAATRKKMRDAALRRYARARGESVPAPVTATTEKSVRRRPY